MKHLMAIVSAVIFTATVPGISSAYQGPSPVDNVKIFHHSSVVLNLGGKTIYIDPWKVTQSAKADIILITHDHHDHFDADCVLAHKKDKTVIIAPQSVVNKVTWKDIKEAEPGKSITVNGFKIEAVPAYNISKPFHPKGNRNVGYVISYKGEKYYHAGDTDATPEMKALKGITVAMLPVGGMYTMNARQAAEAANSFKPAYAVPMHYGTLVGSNKDAEEFASLVSPATRVILLKPIEPMKEK